MVEKNIIGKYRDPPTSGRAGFVKREIVGLSLFNAIKVKTIGIVNYM